MRERIGAWWGRNWDMVLIFSPIVVLGVILVAAILRSIWLNNTQPAYSQNANDVIYMCSHDDLDPGYFIECLERRGYTLSYNGEPVERLDMTYGEWKAGDKHDDK